MNAKFSCPNGHSDTIEQCYTVDIWLPVDLVTGETDVDVSLDGRATDGWTALHYHCADCNTSFDDLIELKETTSVTG